MHLVNLDGAFGENSHQNYAALTQIIASCGDSLSTQLAGGLRTLAQIEYAFNLGITRAILGTAILEDFSFAKKVIATFGSERIVFVWTRERMY